MAGSTFRLLPGDRAPNFSLPDSTGKLRMFYEETRGLPVVLYFLDRSLEAIAALDQITDAQIGIADKAHVFAISKQSGTAEPPEPGRVSSVIHLNDQLGRIGDAYRAAAGLPEGPVLFVLDANQRLIAKILPSRQNDLPQQILDTLAEQVHQVPAAVHVQLAPVLMIPRVFDTEQRKRLIHLFETGGHGEGAVLTTASGFASDRLNYGSKKRLDHWITDVALSRELNSVLGQRLGAEVHRAFNFDGFWLEQYCIGCYDSTRGDFFRPHRDNLIPELASRRFAATINLNDDYEGGGLRFPEYGPHIYRPPAGGAIIFSSSLLHEAVPVTFGRRYVLLTFLRVGAPQDRPRAPFAAATATDTNSRNR
jgi:predicted 2-oxoglutarate/Fe(II)-dependent dioxygenase YbiX